MWDSAHIHLQHTDIKRGNTPQYHPGQLLWLSTRDIHLRLPCRKLSLHYMGPFKVQRQLNDVTYCLELPSHYRISPSFQVSILKPYTDTLSPSTGSGDDGIPPTPDIHSAINTISTHSFIITGILITCTCSPSSASPYQACTPFSSLSGLTLHRLILLSPEITSIPVPDLCIRLRLQILVTSLCLRSLIYIILNLTSFIFI